MQTKPDRLFLDSAGILSLIAATALAIGAQAPAYLLQPHDSIFMMSIPTLFRVVAGVFFILSLLCLFGKAGKMQAAWMAWLATNLGVFWLGLFWSSHGNLSGYFANLPDAFGISARMAGIGAGAMLGFLFLGSCLCLVWIWREEKVDRAVDARKMFCPACGGHIKFAARNAGQQIACPHCQAGIVLQAAGTLKMVCVLCGGHVEFPAHAAGQKIKCPHCKNDITLKAPKAV